GYAVAGKTGTAQKLDPATRRYSHAPGVLSFVGYAPADEPRFAMLVMLDEPRNEKWGSEAAAPIFGAIGREILRYLEVPPRDVQPVQIVTGPPAEPVSPARMRLVSTAEAAQPDGARRMPDLGGKTLRQALEALEPLRSSSPRASRSRTCRCPRCSCPRCGCRSRGSPARSMATHRASSRSSASPGPMARRRPRT